MNYIIIGIQVVIYLVPVMIIGIRIEHRLTKIETDVSWLKGKTDFLCNNSGK
ncbi:hypothetical protein LCGC14_0888570 [marine sediment metagenome]|uniref:Uncharacterized protein n=1 Tax=marine sediment metagenome TaxID=412755 RepID=A0A0F9P4S2_9ZZZZ